MKNEIKLFGPIGRDGVTAESVRDQLDKADKKQMLTVRIHSEGGEVFEGFAIHDAFKDYPGPKQAVIESAAFSIASFIAMAFDDVTIAANGYLMMHNAHVPISGDHAAHAKAAEMLSKLQESLITAYAKRSGKPRDEIVQMMNAETWLNAEEALAGGFVSRISEAHVRERRIAAQGTNIPPAVERALYGTVATGRPKEKKRMSVSIAELRHAMPKASAEFLLSAVERELSIEAALAEYIENLEAKLTKPQSTLGHAPVPMGDGVGFKNAKSEWNRLVNDNVSRGMSRPAACMRVNREHPGLREQMVAEAN